MNHAALLKAISIAGSQKALADGIRTYLDRPKFKQQSVSYWVTNKVELQAEYCRAIEHVTGGQVKREELRPDIFESRVATDAHQLPAVN